MHSDPRKCYRAKYYLQRRAPSPEKLRLRAERGQDVSDKCGSHRRILHLAQEETLAQSNGIVLRDNCG